MTNENKKDWKKVKEQIESEIEENEEFDDEDIAAEVGLGALEHPGYTALEEKLTLAEQQAHENWEKSVRAMAELDNVRRRAQRDVENAHRYGSEKLITSLLPVVDSLEQALQLVDKEKDQAGMREGLELTMKLFLDALAKQDVTQIDPQGELFNPQEHEAMSMVPSPEVAPNTIMAVFQKGYRLADRVIRPARVIVAKANS